MSEIVYQALREAAQNAKDLGGIKNYKRGEQAVAEFESLITPHIVLALLDELEAQSKRIAELTDALTQMINAHKTTMRSGYERIIECGGDCDSPEMMISESPEIRMAETVLKTGMKSE